MLALHLFMVTCSSEVGKGIGIGGNDPAEIGGFVGQNLLYILGKYR